jgi:D-3-phosphoglycerate dehydrogenase
MQRNNVVTADLVAARIGRVWGRIRCIRIYEKLSFETLFKDNTPEAFRYLLKAGNVILSPHVWMDFRKS